MMMIALIYYAFYNFERARKKEGWGLVGNESGS